MSGKDQASPIIIKKKKGHGHGHHGGAWKVAYADFVTAMMAFFLLMWLLGSTTDGDKKGIARYASVDLPMDETLTRIALDLSGRPFLVFRAAFPTEKVGGFDTELVREFFQAFAMNGGLTLHVETVYGDNSHHIAESCFKGLARALRAAVALDPREGGRVPSTKGCL